MNTIFLHKDESQASRDETCLEISKESRSADDAIVAELFDLYAKAKNARCEFNKLRQEAYRAHAHGRLNEAARLREEVEVQNREADALAARALAAYTAHRSDFDTAMQSEYADIPFENVLVAEPSTLRAEHQENQAGGEPLTISILEEEALVITEVGAPDQFEARVSEASKAAPAAAGAAFEADSAFHEKTSASGILLLLMMPFRYVTSHIRAVFARAAETTAGMNSTLDATADALHEEIEVLELELSPQGNEPAVLDMPVVESESAEEAQEVLVQEFPARTIAIVVETISEEPHGASLIDTSILVDDVRIANTKKKSRAVRIPKKKAKTLASKPTRAALKKVSAKKTFSKKPARAAKKSAVSRIRHHTVKSKEPISSESEFGAMIE